MKFKRLSLVCASLAVSLVGTGINASSAQALVNRTADYSAEDLQSFGGGKDKDDPRITRKKFDKVKLNNTFAEEQRFLNALTGAYTTLGFEADEGFTAHNNRNFINEFKHSLKLEMSDDTFLNMTISDENKQAQEIDQKIAQERDTSKKKTLKKDRHNLQRNLTSIQKTNVKLKGSKIFNYQGGRYGIADAGASIKDKMDNQFLNTNAGKNSSLEFSFENQLMSAFSFFATDFDRGGKIALEFTRLDGTTYDVNLEPGDLTADNDRGTANFYGFIADKGDYFTEVNFKLADEVNKNGKTDMVALDRMTFAAAPMKQAVPEPGTGILVLGAVVSGAAFKKRKKK